MAGARDEAAAWAETVQALGTKRSLSYEAVGGLNPKGGPAALCPGGTNRLTGELDTGFWGASCDADEREQGRFGGKAVLPGAVLVKAHMPDLATVVPIFNVESLERGEDVLDRHSRRRVDFESIDFNKRFTATVPRGHDPIASDRGRPLARLRDSAAAATAAPVGAPPAAPVSRARDRADPGRRRGRPAASSRAAGECT